MVKYLQYTCGTRCRYYATYVVLVLLVASPLSTVWAADSLGRLFTNPLQRSDFEHKRDTGYVPPADEGNGVDNNQAKLQQQESVVPEEPLPSSLKINGMVSRNGKLRLLWLNQQMLKQPFKHPQAKVANTSNDEAVLLSIPAKSRVKLKAGQQVVLEQGRVIDVFETVEQNGQAQIIRHKP